MERKRVAEKEVEESRPKKKRKTKYPRLEAWGESQEQEQDMDTITTIQDYVCREGQVGSRQDTTPVPPPPVQDKILLDLESGDRHSAEQVQEAQREEEGHQLGGHQEEVQIQNQG